jgi:hypothetical protein
MRRSETGAFKDSEAQGHSFRALFDFGVPTRRPAWFLIIARNAKAALSLARREWCAA